MIVAMAGLLFVVRAKYFLLYLSLPIPGGFDAVGHFTAGTYYASHLFPSVWGWSHAWFSGMPFPQFYPPLFYFVMAFFYKVLPFSYATIFKSVVLTSVLAVPGLVSILAKKIVNNSGFAYLAGIVTVFALATFGPYANIGINLFSTINVGLVSQALGFPLFLIWVYVFLDISVSRRARYLSMVVLFPLSFSNVHIIPLVVIVVFVSFVVDSISLIRLRAHKQLVSRALMYGQVTVIPVIGAAFWLVPLLSHYHYFSTMALGVETGIGAPGVFFFIKQWWVFFVAIFTALIIGHRKHDRRVLIIGYVSVAVVLPCLFRLDILVPSLPLATYRQLPWLFVGGAILIGYVFVHLQKFVPPLMRILVCALILYPFVFQWASYEPEYQFGLYTRSSLERMDDIAEYMKDKSGRIQIEAYRSGRELASILASGDNPNLSVSYLMGLVESSPTMSFAIGTANGMSQGREKIPVTTFIMWDSNFADQPFAVHLDRAIAIGVSRFFVSSPQRTHEFLNNERVFLERDFGIWKLFSVREEVSLAQILPYEPTVLFAPLSLKFRHSTDYDYMRFSEELFYQNKQDVVLTRALDKRLDRTTDLNRFRFAIISEYEYGDLEKAFARLLKYAQENQLYLVESSDPLFARLVAVGLPNIHIVDQVSDEKAESMPVRAVMAKLFADLDTRKIPISTDFLVEDVLCGENTITVTLQGDVKKGDVPILVKSSYFPTWRRSGSEAVYLASPTYMLTYANEDFKLQFETPKSVYVGYGIALVALVAGAMCMMMDCRRNP
jgi:hypothetical protein